MENVVQIDNLTRDDVKSVLSCRAVNNNISSPVQTTVHLDIICELRMISRSVNYFVQEVDKFNLIQFENDHPN